MLEEYKIIDKDIGIPLNNEHGTFFFGRYKTIHEKKSAEHALIYKGDIFNSKTPVLLRINSACYTSDIFGCRRCDCNWQLKESMKMIHKEGRGLIIYHFHHEGMALGFVNKLKTYKIMDKKNKPTFEAFTYLHMKPDEREFLSTVLILKDLNIKEVDIISNNTKKLDALYQNGIKVHKWISIVSQNPEWRGYLESKRKQFGHHI